MTQIGMADLDLVVAEDIGEMPENNRIVVQVNMEHVATYGHKDTLMELTYGCDFPVRVGDVVSCPPSPCWSKWRAGLVIALGSTYKGPVKYVEPYGKSDKETQ